LVSNFVKEEGAHKLLTKFKGTSYLMSELAYICNKHTKAVLEKADPNDKDSLKINKKQKDDFYKDLDKASADKVVDSIRSRVMGSTQEFIDSNTKDKMKIKDILTNTKEKIENSKDKKIQEGYSNLGKEKVSDIRSKKIQNVFEAMVYSMAKTSLKNEDAKKVFVENSALNMDKLIEHCEVMYTFLTTLDTCKIIDVNESYIEEMLKDLKK
jgi:cobalamin biosynthesis protein CbiD